MAESETEKYTKEDEFVADKDVMDSLRMEYSSASPEEQELVRDLSAHVGKAILDGFGKYIPSDKKESFRSIGDRILVLDEEGIRKFSEEWKPKLPPGDHSTTAGVFYKIGNIVVISDMKKGAWEISETGKNMPEEFPQLDQATVAAYIQYSQIIITITHELVHSAQVKTIERKTTEAFRRFALDECGASFITNEILKNNFPKMVPIMKALEGRIERGRVDMFEKILQKHGEGVYDVFFNNVPEDPKQREGYEQFERITCSEFDSKNLVELRLLKDSLASAFERVADREK